MTETAAAPGQGAATSRKGSPLPRAFARIHDGLTEAGLWAAIAALAGLATLSFIGTLARYFFGTPIGWGPDWASYLLAGCIFAAAPAVTARGQHVAMNLLESVLNFPMGRLLLSFAALILTLAILTTTAWIVWGALRAAYVAGTATAAGYPIPRWWLLAVVFYGFASSAVHVLRSLIGLVATVRSDQNRV
ncbi:TRAP transporter small permease [Arenibacterium halophilum]|uniref:TRAP transporter small permease protein n=1 Tax=Arenibacterium halophilum TaxID=2583821 RepID=A0ABY2X6R2_9RHOB|nr:TRAP transporter small permease [Arenibacterium halophilum]TMV10783.1 TRAP transporter small permease [Arenibacterium halophilum]